MNTKYVAVTADAVYWEGKRKDAVGEFTRKISDGGNLDLITASGKTLKDYDEWLRLPEEERKPGAVQVPELKAIDPEYAPKAPPAGCLRLRVYSRGLNVDRQGKILPVREWLAGVKRDESGKLTSYCYKVPAEPETDVLWLLEDEWKQLVPKGARKGEVLPFPEFLARRICGFYVLGYTAAHAVGPQGDPHESRFKLTVQEATASRVSMRLEGEARLTELNMDFRFLGFLDYDVDRKAFTRFDLVGRSGRTADHLRRSDPLHGSFYAGESVETLRFGMVLEICTGARPMDRIQSVYGQHGFGFSLPK